MCFCVAHHEERSKIQMLKMTNLTFKRQCKMIIDKHVRHIQKKLNFAINPFEMS